MKRSLLFLAVAACALGAAATPSLAQSVRGYEQSTRAVPPGFFATAPAQPVPGSLYDSDGSYKSESAYEHSIWGRPCGQECD